MIAQLKNETRAEYMLRVAAAYIRKNCIDSTIDYDETTSDGYCLADECDSARIELIMKGQTE